MNNNNLNWSDNRVLGNAANKPYNEQTGVSPYMEEMPIAPYKDGNTHMSYQESTVTPPRQMGVQPSATQDSMMPSRSLTGSMPSTPSTPSMPSVPLTTREETMFDVMEAPSDMGRLGTMEGPPPVFNPYYIPGYLRRNIGKRVRAEFTVGENLYIDKTGILREVGVNYFVLEDNVTRAMIMCDLYSVRFVTSV
jgi:hypothetical protein